MRITLTILLVWILLSFAAHAQLTPENAVTAHFDAIEAEQYTEADSLFSSPFRSAFKGDVETLNHYYLVRRKQIRRGYTFIETRPLADEDHVTALVVVDFAPADNAPIAITERLYYYLILERQQEASAQTDSENMAWRIDIFDSFLFDTLGEARRRPYLYTKESWPDQESKELKSRQGLFRIQWALESYYFDELQYPGELFGGNHKRDKLIDGGYLTGSYPASGFNNRPMEGVGTTEKSSGDYTYISFDSIGDGELDGYWLLLHGKVRKNYYYNDSDIIYILSNTGVKGQHALAEAFANFWSAHSGDRELTLTSASQAMKPMSALLPVPEVDSEPEQTDTGIIERQITGIPVFRDRAGADWRGITDNIRPVPAIAELADSFWDYVTAKGPGVIELGLPEVEPAVMPEAEPLLVYHYGF